MKIREVQKKDIDQWSKMRTALWSETNDAHISEIKEYYSGDSIDIAIAFVGEIDTEIIGFIELNIRNFAEGSRQPKVPYVEAWYIKPNFQGKGYGAQLMQQAEKWALAEGFSELASDTEIYNKRSIAIHKQLGFAETERVVCFLKNLKH